MVKSIAGLCLCCSMLVVSHTSSARQYSKSFTLTMEEAKVADEDFKVIRFVSIKVRHIKQLDDTDIVTLRDIILRPKQTVVVKIEALKPFTYLRPKTLKAGQETLIAEFIKKVLAFDDAKTDPAGAVKYHALIVTGNCLRTRTLLPALEPLKKDKRGSISVEATNIAKHLSGVDGH